MSKVQRSAAGSAGRLWSWAMSDAAAPRATHGNGKAAMTHERIIGVSSAAS
jgi:hypothetical protein